MFHAILFCLLAGLFVLFATGAARAGQIMVAIPAGVLAAWMLGLAWTAARRAAARAPRTPNDDGRT